MSLPWFSTGVAGSNSSSSSLAQQQQQQQAQTTDSELAKRTGHHQRTLSSGGASAATTTTTGIVIDPESKVSNSHSSHNGSLDLYHAPDPPNLTRSKHNVVTIRNSSNQKMFIAAAIVAVFLIVEVFVLRAKMSSPAAKKQEATTEMLAVFWSAIVSSALCWMVQHFELQIDEMAMLVTYTEYRCGFVPIKRRKFSPAAVEDVVVKAVLSSSSSSAASRRSYNKNEVRHSVEIFVSEFRHGTGPLSGGESLLVDYVVGAAEAMDAAKSWAGLFHRYGAKVELAASPVAATYANGTAGSSEFPPGK